MKKNKCVICLLFLALHIPSPASSQWRSLNGPPGGSIVDISRLRDRSLASSFEGGFHVSRDSGNSWEVLSNPGLYVTCVAIIRDSIVIAGGEYGIDSLHIAEHSILRSTDDGRTWLEARSGIPDSFLNISCLTVQDSVAYVGTGQGLFYKTVDFGNSWTPLSPPVPQNAFWYNLCVLRPYLFLLTAGGNPWLFRSSDYGSTWSAIDNGLPSSAMEKFVVCGDYLFVNAQRSGPGGIFRSSDFGGSWLPADSGFAGVSPILLFSADSLLFIQDRFGNLYRSTDLGSSWDSAGSGYQGGRIITMHASGRSILLGTAAHGVYRSLDGGSSWAFLESGPATGTVRCLAGDHEAVVSGMSPYFSQIGFPTVGLAVYRGNPPAWTSKPVSHPVTSLCAGENRFLAGTSGEGVLQSSDAGFSWAAVNAGLPWMYTDCVASVDSFAYCGHAAYPELSRALVTDFSWINYSQALGGNPLALIADSTQLYLGADLGMYRRLKNGAYWMGSWAGMGRLQTTDLAFNESTLFAATKGGVFRSTDKALHWQQANNGLGLAVPTCLGVYHGAIFAGTASGVFCSTDNGGNWYSVSEGLMSPTINDLLVVDSLVYAGTNMGVWYRPGREMIGTVDVQEPGPRPASFILEQNYPNPFNAQTIFTYHLPEREMVHGEICNTLGQQLVAIIEGWQEAGTHRVAWNAVGLSSGVYFFRLRAGGYFSTRKVLLLR